jgi:hypothetical protein
VTKFSWRCCEGRGGRESEGGEGREEWGDGREEWCEAGNKGTVMEEGYLLKVSCELVLKKSTMKRNSLVTASERCLITDLSNTS